jgi:hypothetical protein
LNIEHCIVAYLMTRRFDGAPPDAVQVQFDDVVTDTVPVPPEAGID